MTIYYVGKGGSDAENGTTWALRKLTLNGAEDIPVASGDTVYVGPGVYRERLDLDVSGTSMITYIGDVTGENTDGIGGVVRITGSDDDQTATRGNCIFNGGTYTRNYRTFRGFVFDLATNNLVETFGPSDYITIEDCVFTMGAAGYYCLFLVGTNNYIRRCIFMPGRDPGGIRHWAASDNTDVSSVIENCIFIGGGDNFQSFRTQGITIRNCTFLHGRDDGVDCDQAITGTIDVNNCIFFGISGNALEAAETGDIIENYNSFSFNFSDRSLVDTGAQSNDYPPLFDWPVLLDGFMLKSYMLGILSEWSTIKRITGTGESTGDFFGIDRPTISSKKSWGAFQYRGIERETITTRGTSAASLKLDDAGEAMFFVPVDGSQITISAYAYHEADYTGTLPQMIIQQPGQSDRTTTDTGSHSTWNLLTDTFTPSGTDFVVVTLRSLNEATSGNYDVFFEDLDVS